MEEKLDVKSSPEEQGLDWGRSLPVPSVQEIVRKDPLSIPSRYIRDQVDRVNDADISPHSADVPVIDFSLLSSGNQDERNKLELACKEWGFFQVINHGISEDTLKKTRIAMTGFFGLSLEERNNYKTRTNDFQGYGQAYVVSEEQKLDWNDGLFLITLPGKFRNMKYWPTIVPGFKNAFEMYSNEVNRVTVELLANLSLTMNMNMDSLLKLHGEMKQGMRMNYYPPCCKPDEVMGISPHSDSGSITILLQDDDISALQIKHQGCWVPVKPIPNALVVNIGDVIEAWSNGMYKSIEHRAVTNEKKARMSLATFVLPDDDMEIGPVDEMVDDVNHPAMYKTVMYVDYLRYTLARKMDGKANLHSLKLSTC